MQRDELANMNCMRGSIARRWSYKTSSRTHVPLYPCRHCGVKFSATYVKSNIEGSALGTKVTESRFDKVPGRVVILLFLHTDLCVSWPGKISNFFSRTHNSDFTWKFNVGSKSNLVRNCTGNRLGVLSRAMEACKTFVYGHWWLNNSRFSVKIHLWKNIEENGKMGDQNFLMDFGESIFPGPPVKIRGQSELSSLRYLRRCLWIVQNLFARSTRVA